VLVSVRSSIKVELDGMTHAEKKVKKKG